MALNFEGIGNPICIITGKDEKVLKEKKGKVACPIICVSENEKDITKPFAKILTHLILSLESNDDFHIKDLYELPPEEFDLAIEVLKEWRIDRHYMGKSKTFAAAYYASALTQ